MKTLIRIAEILSRILFWVVVVTACCALFSCRTVYVPVETVRTEVVKELEIQRDSIYVLDSIYVREAHDTVYITKWRTEYKEALRVDTLNIQRIDTLQTIVEVEKKLTKWQQMKMDVGLGTMIALPLLLALYILYRRLKK